MQWKAISWMNAKKIGKVSSYIPQWWHRMSLRVGPVIYIPWSQGSARNRALYDRMYLCAEKKKMGCLCFCHKWTASGAWVILKPKRMYDENCGDMALIINCLYFPRKFCSLTLSSSSGLRGFLLISILQSFASFTFFSIIRMKISSVVWLLFPVSALESLLCHPILQRGKFTPFVAQYLWRFSTCYW